MVKKVLNETPIEEMLLEHPGANRYFLERGMRCLQCGEPYWGPVASFLKEQGMNPPGIAKFLEGLNAFLAGEEGDVVE